MVSIDIEKMKLEKREKYKSYCFQNCLTILLKCKGISNADLYINGALGIEGYFESDNFYINEADGMRGVLPSLAGIYKRINCSGVDSIEVFNQNIQYLHQHNCPLIVDLDTYYLPYASNYQKNHALHSALLIGTEDYKNVHLLDWYAPWFFWGKVDIKQYIMSRKSKNSYDGTIYSGAAVNNNYYMVNVVPHRSSESLFYEMLECSKENCKVQKLNMYLGGEAYVQFKEYLRENYLKESNVDYSNQFYYIACRYYFWIEYLIKAQELTGVDNSLLIQKSQMMTDQIEVIRYLLLKMKFSKSVQNKEKLLLHIDDVIHKQYEIEDIILDTLKILK